MSSPTRGKDDDRETYPTICPRCHTEGELNSSPRSGISQLSLLADGTIERDEPKEQGFQYGLVCPKCHRKYWMLIEFVAGKVSSIRISTRPLLSMPEDGKEVESVEVFYSRSKKWWFSKRGEKIEEIGPGEPPDSSLR